MWRKVGECGTVRLESGGSVMFMGEYRHSIDAKGRLIIPAKFREDLGETFVLTRGLDQCLFGYPLQEWKILEEKLKALPLTKKRRTKLHEIFLFGSNGMRTGQTRKNQYSLDSSAIRSIGKGMCSFGSFQSN